VEQYQRGVVFRFGKLLPEILGPGLHFIVLGVPGQGAITRDDVTLTVDAVVYFRVIDPVKALVNSRTRPARVPDRLRRSGHHAPPKAGC
jgi:regulator of protease activity HflC (stomatin/prohibitin superfamily)